MITIFGVQKRINNNKKEATTKQWQRVFFYTNLDIVNWRLLRIFCWIGRFGLVARSKKILHEQRDISYTNYDILSLFVLWAESAHDQTRTKKLRIKKYIYGWKIIHRQFRRAVIYRILPPLPKTSNHYPQSARGSFRHFYQEEHR